jgi:hypothetical protein
VSCLFSAIKVGRPTALGGQSSNALTSVSMLLGGGLAPKAAGVNAAEAGKFFNYFLFFLLSS